MDTHQRTALWFAWLFSPLFVWMGCNGLEQTTEARQLTGELQARFASAAEATNRAVTASNGESAAGFVREADTARDSLKRTEQSLATLLRDREYSEEAKLLKDFHSKFVAYEVLDRSILTLTLENTNARASRPALGREADVATTLGEKRALVSACQESLQALAQTLTERISRPTR